MKKLAPIFALLLLLSACKKEELPSNAACKPYTTVQSTWTDDVTLVSGRIVDDCLELVVGYGGGCEAHEFELVWQDLGMICILPTYVHMKLHHNANGDRCEAYLTDTLHFDLSGSQNRKDAITELAITTSGSSTLAVAFDE
jgi:NigD-like C-terminal beta sandwich domain